MNAELYGVLVRLALRSGDRSVIRCTTFDLGRQPEYFGGGHEFQRSAPACWTATLRRGGVLRMKTWWSAIVDRKRGLVTALAEREGRMVMASPDWTVSLPLPQDRGHCLRRHVDFGRLSSSLCRFTSSHR